MEVYYGVLLSATEYFTALATEFWANPRPDPLRDYIFEIHKEEGIKLTLIDLTKIERNPIKFLTENPYKLSLVPYYQYLKFIPVNSGYSVLLGYSLNFDDYQILPLEEVLTPEIKAKVDQELHFNNILNRPEIYLFKTVNKDKLRYHPGE
jgi:hypothetical protein